MPLPRSLARALLVLAPAVALAAGLHLLFELRFEHGDVWPAGSSFRADPLGTKILYVALGELPGVRTERLLKPFAHAKIEPPATILAVSLDADALRYAGRDQGQPILDFLEKGGRVVLACAPDEAVDPSKRRPAWMDFTDDPATRARKKKAEAAKKGAKPGGSASNAAPASATNATTNATSACASATNAVAKDAVSTNAPAPAAAAKGKGAKPAAGKRRGTGKPGGDGADGTNAPPRAEFSLLKVWGIEALVVTQRQGRAESPATNRAIAGSAVARAAGTNAGSVTAAGGKAAPPAPRAPPAVTAGSSADGGFRPVEWHSALYFRPGTGTPWRVVYACGDRPVMVERPWGRGTVVLASDSYFTSNEAMLKDRHPALLAWLAGGAGRIVFDEFHLGVREEPGVALLARRYGLGGIVAVLALLAGLFVWRNATSFLPPAGVESDEGGVAGGLESRNALLNLLCRHLPAADLPRVCFEQWARSRPRHDPRSERRVARMRETLDTEQRKPPAERDPVAACRAMHDIWKENEKP